MKHILLFILFFTGVQIAGFAQMKQASSVSFLEMCNGEIHDWDHENAIINFNVSTQTLELSTDIKEAIDDISPSEGGNFEQSNGVPISLIAHFNIPDLEHKTSSDNGTTYTVETEIKCNGITTFQKVTYTFFFAPIVAQKDAAPLCNFRLDFTVSIDIAKMNLHADKTCTNILMKVPDALLNVVY